MAKTERLSSTTLLNEIRDSKSAGYEVTSAKGIYEGKPYTAWNINNKRMHTRLSVDEVISKKLQLECVVFRQTDEEGVTKTWTSIIERSEEITDQANSF